MKTQINKYIYTILFFLFGILIGYIPQSKKINDLKEETILTHLIYSLGLFQIPIKDTRLSKRMMIYAIIPHIEYIGKNTIDIDSLEKICTHWNTDYISLNKLLDYNSSFIDKHTSKEPFLKGYKTISNYCSKP